MDIYEKPRMEVIEMNESVVVTSCEFYDPNCNTEGPAFCIWGDE